MVWSLPHSFYFSTQGQLQNLSQHNTQDCESHTSKEQTPPQDTPSGKPGLLTATPSCWGPVSNLALLLERILEKWAKYNRVPKQLGEDSEFLWVECPPHGQRLSTSLIAWLLPQASKLHVGCGGWVCSLVSLLFCLSVYGASTSIFILLWTRKGSHIHQVSFWCKRQKVHIN